MKVDKVFINTYKYDFHLAKICIASVRYWYPEIPIYIIKDENQGRFSTSFVEKSWNVKVLNIQRKKFGWGYGKLEPLFLEPSFSFLVLDADTVLTGPVLEKVENINADFIVDGEKQPESRFNEIYYDLKRIREVDKEFTYPGYSFNSGQWFGSTGKILRSDFDLSLEWSEPPSCRFPEIVFKGDQAHLNFTLHRLEYQKRTSVARIKLMIWPDGNNADFIDLEKVKSRSRDYQYIIHWAGMGGMKESSKPRYDIISFYKDLYYSRAGGFHAVMDRIKGVYNQLERKIAYRIENKKSRS